MNDVGRSFGEVKALQHVSLDLGKGEVTAVVGVNGSGKTTLLRLLAGLDAPSYGEVNYEGRRLSPKELRMVSTMVFQRTVMFNSSVYSNISFGLRASGFSRSEVYGRVKESLIKVGLQGFEWRGATELSGGEQQRVSLARALILDRPILLLDEPTANLDLANALSLEKSIKELKDTGIQTVVLATHNLHQAKRLSDKIVHLFAGRVVEASYADVFFNTPRSPLSRRFIEGELQF